MPLKSVFCFASSHAQAGQIVDRLRAANFASQNISALGAGNGTSRNFTDEMRSRSPEGAVAGAGIGGVLGWMAGIGVFAIPGFGPFIDASPILAALCAVAAGAAAGGIAGEVIGKGWLKFAAAPSEDKLQDGNVLISVHTETTSEITLAEVIFAHSGGQGIGTKRVEADPEDARAPATIQHPTKSSLKGAARQCGLDPMADDARTF